MESFVLPPFIYLYAVFLSGVTLGFVLHMVMESADTTPEQTTGVSASPAASTIVINGVEYAPIAKSTS